MGWGLVAARRHARRLEDQRWLERHRMTRGDGSLFVASRQGVLVSGVAVSASAAPSPMLEAHDCACAWTAAWFTVRGADWQGPREVLADPDLKGDLEWQTRSGWRCTAHDHADRRRRRDRLATLAVVCGHPGRVAGITEASSIG